jgi:titin
MKAKYSVIFSMGVITLLFMVCIPFVSADITVPGAPINCLRVLRSEADGYHMDLSWDPPKDNGGSEITGYKIEISENPVYYSGNQSDLWIVIEADTGTPDTDYTHIHPTTISYCYRVSAINSVGTGLPSVYFPSPSCGQADVPTRPQNVVTTRISANKIDISWDLEDDKGLPVIGYKIEYKTYWDPDIKVLVNNTNSQATSYSHTTATHDWTYYRVYAINAMGTSQYSIGQLPGGWVTADKWDLDTEILPGPPLNLVAERMSLTRVELSWDPPDDTGGAEIIGYNIECKSDRLGSDFYFCVYNTNSSDTSYTYTSSMTNESYYFRVSAINTNGIGNASNVAQISSWDSTGLVPGPVRNFKAVVHYCAINLTWDHPVDDGGSPITGYHIRYSRSPSIEKTGVTLCLTSNTYFNHTGENSNDFYCGKTYYYDIWARNENGSGERSSTHATVRCSHDDYDCDGVIDIVDNCPDKYNPLQNDTDLDGKGNICDPCPHDPYNNCEAANDVDDEPGFELLVFLISIVLVFLWNKKRKKV